jgi:hypothetical protein
VFATLDWNDGQLVVNGWHFHNEVWGADQPDGASDSFQLYKPTSLLRDMHEAMAAYPALAPRRILEVGMWDGGSLALMNELYQPEVLIGVDLAARGDSPYFSEYVEAHPDTRFLTRWGVDQGDSSALRSVLREAADPSLDLVVDDGAHLYGPTKAAFEELFPRVRAGGLYIIEDYGWAHLPEFQTVELWANQRSMADFTHELVQMMTSEDGGAIAKITYLPSLVVVERGPGHLAPGFSVDSRIRRRKPRTIAQRLHLLARRGKHFAWKRGTSFAELTRRKHDG